MTTFDPKRILIEDDRFLAVQKDAGDLVVADRWGIEKNILLHKVGEYLRSVGHTADASGRDLYPVHRLDRETSGVVLFAKDEDAHRELSILFEGRKMQKTYWAITCGMPEWDECDCNVPLSRAEGKHGRGRALVSLTKGKEASTRFSLKERYGDIALVEAFPLTGRLHQIRVHLNVLGLPILGDKTYGPEKWKSASFPNIRAERVMLHARRIEFQHPFSGKNVKVECPLSVDMRSLINELKQSNR